MKNLATKYRPKKFSDVVGQVCVLDILQNQLESGEYKNAYLFCGGAGTGKTTTARIFAHEINSGKGTPIEIDAASNNGVDNVRDVITDAKFKSLDSEFKVYVIDEVHMLSIGAFNALLKTLEEPPEGTLFLLCTTDPQKIPATILSRVQRFNFVRIQTEEIVRRLKFILESENQEIIEAECGSQDAVNDIEWAIQEGLPVYTWEEDALFYIAKLADGGMRDAITMLDKVLGYSADVTVEVVEEALGVPDYKVFLDLWNAVSEKDLERCITIINSVHMKGKDLKLFIRNYADYSLDVCKYIITGDLNVTSIPKNMINVLKDIKGDLAYATKQLKKLNKLANDVKWDNNPKTYIQAFFIVSSMEED